MDLTIKGTAYRTGKLNAFQQFHISRRLAPVFAVMGFEAVRLARAPAEQDEVKALDRFLEVLPAAAEVLAKMSDEDANYVLHTCLGVCSRHVLDGRYQPMLAQGGVLQFNDLNMDEMLQLVVAVVQENLAGFLTGLEERAHSPSP